MNLNKINNHSGFTLIELIISIVIFSAILYGVSRVFIDITDTVRTDGIRLNLSNYIDRAFDKIEMDISQASSIDRNPSYLGNNFDVISITKGNDSYIYSFNRKDGIMVRSNTVNNGIAVPIYKALGSSIRYNNTFGIQSGDAPINDCKNNNYIIDKFRIFSKDWDDAMPSNISEGRGEQEYLLRLKAYVCGTNDEKLEYLQFDRLIFAGNLFINSQKDAQQY